MTPSRTTTETGLIEENSKDVYAHFGLAIYHAQVLEHVIVNAMLVLKLLPEEIHKQTERPDWTARVDDFMDSEFQKTLGALIKKLKTIEGYPPSLDGLLEEARKKRNWLSHTYFRERAEVVFSVDGLRGMIQELEEAQNIFRMAHNTLESALWPLWEKYGINKDFVEEEVRQIEKGSQ